MANAIKDFGRISMFGNTRSYVESWRVLLRAIGKGDGKHPSGESELQRNLNQGRDQWYWGFLVAGWVDVAENNIEGKNWW